MNRTNLFLTITLVIQVALLIILGVLPRGEAATDETALLANFNVEAVTGLQITDADGESVELVKDDSGTWRMPALGNYPADAERVTNFLTSVAALQTDRLIASNPTSHRRLKVAPDEFERLVEVRQGDTVYNLYIGTSGGPSATHMRVNDSPEVYLTSGLSAWQAGTTFTTWGDTTYFNVTSDAIVSLTLDNANGTFAFEKVGDSWRLADQTDAEVFNGETFDLFLNRASTLVMREPLGREALPEYGMESPQATLTLVVNETLVSGGSDSADSTPEPGQTIEITYTIQVGAKQEEDFVVKASNSDFYVLVSETAVGDYIENSRDDFVVSIGS